MKFRKNRLYLSLQYRKKLLYVFFSLILSLGLLCTGVLDLVFLLALEKPDITTHSALTTVMVLHAVAFYLALFGFAYSFDAKFYSLSYLAIIAGGISLSSLLMRIIQELVLIGFYPPAYAVT